MASSSSSSSSHATDDDGQKIILAIDGELQALQAFDYKSGEMIRKLVFDHSPLTLAVSHDSKHAAVGFIKVDPVVICVKTFEIVQKIELKRALGLAYSHDGKFFAVAGGPGGETTENYRIGLRAYPSYDVIATMCGEEGTRHDLVILSATFSSFNHSRLATGCCGKIINIWEVPTMVHLIKISTFNWVGNLLFISEACIVSGGARDKLEFWNLSDGRRNDMASVTGGVTSTALSLDKSKMVRTSSDNLIVYNCATFRPDNDEILITPSRTACALWIDERTILVSQYEDTTILVDIVERKIIKNYKNIENAGSIAIASVRSTPRATLPPIVL